MKANGAKIYLKEVEAITGLKGKMMLRIWRQFLRDFGKVEKGKAMAAFTIIMDVKFKEAFKIIWKKVFVCLLINLETVIYSTL